MRIVKTFKHPAHALNYCRALLKKELRDYRPLPIQAPPCHRLEQNNSYYFIYETFPNFQLNIMVWGICCFDADGVILFQKKGHFPVSLHRYIRQGMARTSVMIEGVIKAVFRRESIPLISEAPFNKMDDSLYLCNISWAVYQSYFK